MTSSYSRTLQRSTESERSMLSFPLSSTGEDSVIPRGERNEWLNRSSVTCSKVTCAHDCYPSRLMKGRNEMCVEEVGQHRKARFITVEDENFRRGGWLSLLKRVRERKGVCIHVSSVKEEMMAGRSLCSGPRNAAELSGGANRSSPVVARGRY